MKIHGVYIVMNLWAYFSDLLKGWWKVFWFEWLNENQCESAECYRKKVEQAYVIFDKEKNNFGDE